ncbi:MAG: Csu type fimbrial protein [Gammaproteobacteria bacterium]
MTHTRTRLVAAAVCLIALHTTSANAQQATGSIDVTATVPTTCVLGTSTDVDFGTLTMVVGNGAVTATGSIDWACSDGTTAEIGIDGVNGTASRQMTNPAPGSSPMPYNLYQSTGPNVDWGPLLSGDQLSGLAGSGISNVTTENVFGEIAETNYIDAVPGSYSQTLTVTIEF